MTCYNSICCATDIHSNTALAFPMKNQYQWKNSHTRPYRFVNIWHNGPKFLMAHSLLSGSCSDECFTLQLKMFFWSYARTTMYIKDRNMCEDKAQESQCCFSKAKYVLKRSTAYHNKIALLWPCHDRCT